MMDFYTVAADSFQAHLDWIEKQGRKDSPDWHLANGLVCLAQGLQQDHVDEEERRKSFARSVGQQHWHDLRLATKHEAKIARRRCRPVRGNAHCTGHGAAPRIMRLLLSAHPDGLVVGDIQKELGLTASNLSHHLEKLKNEELVRVRRDGTFLWYSANAAALRDLLSFLYSECCTRNQILDPDAVVHIKN